MFLCHYRLELRAIELLHLEAFITGAPHNGLDKSRPRRKEVLEAAYERLMSAELRCVDEVEHIDDV